MSREILLVLDFTHGGKWEYSEHPASLAIGTMSLRTTSFSLHPEHWEDWHSSIIWGNEEQGTGAGVHSNRCLELNKKPQFPLTASWVYKDAHPWTWQDASPKDPPQLGHTSCPQNFMCLSPSIAGGLYVSPQMVWENSAPKMCLN